MKNAFLLLLFSILQCSLSGQTSSVFHIETEYTPTNGYRYYFDKLDPQSGISVRISQLPVEGFFTGYSFFNCYGHFVFQGIDSVLPNGNYVNKLYELDTLGHLLRTLPMDTATGTWYKACLPSADSPYYYALRWSTSTGQWVLETIHALSGTRNMQTLTQLVSFNYWNSDATITRDDVLWFGMDDQMQGTSVLIRVDPSNGQVSIEDTLSAGLGYYYDCLNYDCVNDTIYGFITHMDSVAGSELLKVHGASGTVIHSGSTTTGNGLFNAGTHTRLADGRFYVMTTGSTYLLPDFYVSSPTFTLPVTTSPSALSAFCFAAPRESCVYFTTCEGTSGIVSSPETIPTLLYPNPVSNGVLHIQFDGFFNVELIDVSGRLVYSGEGRDLITIPVDALVSGIYAVRAREKQGGSCRSQRVLINN